jgi:endonuclease G, mitochondrial
MPRLSWLSTVLFILIVSLVQPAQAAEETCQSQLYLGAAPVLKNPKLSERTSRVCFSEISLLYSGVARTPLWSAEHLTVARIQQARGLPRLQSNAFHEELSLPADLRSELDDYRRSGFDRGHMAPNGDMSTHEAQQESFSLANMIPQDPCNNEVLWEGIESAVRELALSNGEVYVVTGPAFLGTELQSLKGRVLVPTHVFKAVYLPSRNQAGVYFAPNDGSQSWEPISVSELEKKINLDVFPSLSAGVKQSAMSLPKPTAHFGCRLHTSEAAPARQGPLDTQTAPAAPSATATGSASAAEYGSEAEARKHCPGETVVWVNTRSQVYHSEGSPFYGNTKNGAYMCEKDTASAGFRSAKNERHPR